MRGAVDSTNNPRLGSPAVRVTTAFGGDDDRLRIANLSEGVCLMLRRTASNIFTVMLIGCLLVGPCFGATDGLTIEQAGVRVVAEQVDGTYSLRFDQRSDNGQWRTVLSNTAETKAVPWVEQPSQVTQDVELEWQQGDTREAVGRVFTEAAVDADGKSLLLSGQRGVHRLEERVELVADGIVRITVRDQIDPAARDVRLGKLLSHFYFVPDARATGYALPVDFAWLPNLHWREGQVCGDHFFRSPAAIVASRGLYAALVPDLDVLAARRDVPHALDLRYFDHPASSPYGVPRLSYGLCPWRIDGHVYTTPSEPVAVRDAEQVYAFDVLLGQVTPSEHVAQRVARHLWDRYGHRYFQDIRPQVMPFEEYGRRYSYVHELPRWATRVALEQGEGYGINNQHRRGVNYHAWENDLHIGFGVWHHAERWHDDNLAKIGQGMVNLQLSAPRDSGAFPCVFNLQTHAWEGSLYWTSWPAYPMDGYDSQAMGVTAWWQIYWLETFPSFGSDARVRDSVTEYARFLASAQLPSGAIPTYFDSQLLGAPQLRESATTAISGAVLAKVAQWTGDAELRRAALAAGHFIEREILPSTKFQDFEVFYSCSPKPLHWSDPVNGIPPVNNLAIQWTADQFLALHQLTQDTHWLQLGEQTLGLLSLFQQVWSPPHYDVYLYGGFGVMNTDGEWNDGRQARFVSTYADYYRVTGNPQYLERAVAACRAGFALMDIAENHDNRVNGITRPEGPGQGYASENIFHGGPDNTQGGWTGYNWGPGGALAASAYLERQFGSVWVDGATQTTTPIDGVTARVTSWTNQVISLQLDSAMRHLPRAFTGAQRLVVRFGNLPPGTYCVRINEIEFNDMSEAQLANGVVVELPAS